jgi:hypothetical protein
VQSRLTSVPFLEHLTQLACGYGGCEVLAISNWILRRDDQVGCLALSPIDEYERRMKSAG